jgi:hypothetical protein
MADDLGLEPRTSESGVRNILDEGQEVVREKVKQ